MPLIRAYHRLPPGGQLAVQVGFLVLFLGAQLFTAFAVWLSAQSDVRAGEAAHDAAVAARDAHIAAVRAERLATCVKEISSKRGYATSLDAVANIIFMRAIDQFEHAILPPNRATPAQYEQASKQLRDATDRAVALLKEDQRIRRAHTYTRCSP
jgi:hypothetical protein